MDHAGLHQTRGHSDSVDPGLPHKCGLPTWNRNAAFTRQPLRDKSGLSPRA